MKIGTATLVTAIAVALTGCASPPQRPEFVKKETCSAKKCSVEVQLIAAWIWTSIDDLELKLDLGANKDREVTIEWQLKWSPGFEFRADSIEFKADTPNTGQFHDPVVLDEDDRPQQKGGKKFRWVDRNTDDKLYKYTIKVYPKLLDTPFTRDPTIKNQG